MGGTPDVIQLVGGAYYDFDQLGAEFTLAAVPFTSIGTDGTTIFTYDDMANQISLPPEADPIIAMHIPSHLQRDLLVLLAQPAVGGYVMTSDTPPLLALDPTTAGLLFTSILYRLGALDKTTLAILPIESWIDPR